MARLGYRRFRAVQQAYLEGSPPAHCPDGGIWRFEPGGSGPLPEVTPKPWRPLVWVMLRYCGLFFLYGLVGPRSRLRALARDPSPWIGGLPRRLLAWADRRQIPLPGWYHSHAMLGK